MVFTINHNISTALERGRFLSIGTIAAYVIATMTLNSRFKLLATAQLFITTIIGALIVRKGSMPTFSKKWSSRTIAGIRLELRKCDVVFKRVVAVCDAVDLLAHAREDYSLIGFFVRQGT